MRIPRIFTTQPLSIQSHCVLEESAAHHLVKVLRFEIGRALILFNNQGGEYLAQITAIEKKSVVVFVTEFLADDRESPLQLELAISISRGERMDWVLQKATELGVTKIQPLITERTEVKLRDERGDKKFAHWQQILISACEQSQRNRVPLLQAPQKLSDWISNARADLKYVLHHRDSQGFSATQKVDSLILLIGPEGGLSDSEILLARTHDFSALTLGPRVMRTETAPLAAISIAQSLWGDF